MAPSSCRANLQREFSKDFTQAMIAKWSPNVETNDGPSSKIGLTSTKRSEASRAAANFNKSSASTQRSRRKAERGEIKKWAIPFVRGRLTPGRENTSGKKKRRYSCVQVWACNASVNIQHLRHSDGASSKTINVSLSRGIDGHFSAPIRFSFRDSDFWSFEVIKWRTLEWNSIR